MIDGEESKYQGLAGWLGTRLEAGLQDWLIRKWMLRQKAQTKTVLSTISKERP